MSRVTNERSERLSSQLHASRDESESSWLVKPIGHDGCTSTCEPASCLHSAGVGGLAGGAERCAAVHNKEAQPCLSRHFHKGAAVNSCDSVIRAADATSPQTRARARGGGDASMSSLAEAKFVFRLIFTRTRSIGIPIRYPPITIVPSLGADLATVTMVLSLSTLAPTR